MMETNKPQKETSKFGDYKPAKPKKQPKDPVNFKKYWKLVIGLTSVFVLFIILLANVYIVKESEYRIVRQFGEVVAIKDQPGLHMKIPFIQSVTTLPKYQMIYEVSEAEINTRDKKRIIIDNYAVWHVVDPRDLITNAGTIINAESRMEELSLIHI